MTSSKSVELLVQFPSLDTFYVDFYVTLIDLFCLVVLGHNWLTHYNPLIDWVLGSITFQTSLLDSLANLPLVNGKAASAPNPTPLEPGSTPKLALDLRIQNPLGIPQGAPKHGLH